MKMTKNVRCGQDKESRDIFSSGLPATWCHRRLEADNAEVRSPRATFFGRFSVVPVVEVLNPSEKATPLKGEPARQILYSL